MEYLRSKFPILFSPTFWGLTLSFIFKVLAYKEAADVELLNIISTWLISVTGVNIVWKGAKKIGGK